MDAILKSLKKSFGFKETTDIGDVIVVVHLDKQMLTFGRVFDILRDETKRGDWWNVYIQYLTIPPHVEAIKLRTPQYSGKEEFTVKGERIFMAALDIPTVAGTFDKEDEPVKENPFKVIDGGKNDG